MMYYFYPKRKDIAIKNIEIAFPSKTLTLKHTILKSCYKHYGMVLVDFLRDELGGDVIGDVTPQVEASLRALLYLILSTPEYQLA